MSASMKKLVDFICASTPSDDIVHMECDLYCDKLAVIAERVVAGEKLSDILPEFDAHICNSPDCREEFEALVAVLRAEKNGNPSA
jgi:hypothetical protein